ncbi:hypothetical protein [Chelativorans intermedius]|uniref:Uncharacterized protein n=1 Tax=Chelativorans intermedius TaxID=515947 RepID=A0ABV6D8Y1_9HYPH|nr:hypothetical protein [Chelativorans intermedius]MCT8997758.1 hypothetical protein [Chelativorans intermedius]
MTPPGLVVAARDQSCGRTADLRIEQAAKAVPAGTAPWEKCALQRAEIRIILLKYFIKNNN